jgi:predicted GNAT family N-acyltransferase
LYEREGYVERGTRFVEEGIEHVAMEKVLAREP